MGQEYTAEITAIISAMLPNDWIFYSQVLLLNVSEQAKFISRDSGH